MQAEQAGAGAGAGGGPAPAGSRPPPSPARLPPPRRRGRPRQPGVWGKAQETRLLPHWAAMALGGRARQTTSPRSGSGRARQSGRVPPPRLAPGTSAANALRAGRCLRPEQKVAPRFFQNNNNFEVKQFPHVPEV